LIDNYNRVLIIIVSTVIWCIAGAAQGKKLLSIYFISTKPNSNQEKTVLRFFDFSKNQEKCDFWCRKRETANTGFSNFVLISVWLLTFGGVECRSCRFFWRYVGESNDSCPRGGVSQSSRIQFNCRHIPGQPTSTARCHFQLEHLFRFVLCNIETTCMIQNFFCLQLRN
jgi:hypothetical protein